MAKLKERRTITRSKSRVDQRANVTDVARSILRQRLGTVIKALNRSFGSSGECMWSEEDVHALRVATRRATAALQMFDSLLPEKKFQWWRKRLKKLRRAAGDARDLDVLYGLLTKREIDQTTDGRKILRALELARPAAQRPLMQLAGEHSRKKMLAKRQSLVQRIRWRGEGEEPTYREFVEQPAEAAWKQFTEKGSLISMDFESLHELRIAGKRLRYSIETLSPVVPRKWHKQMLTDLKECQDRLGKINDLVMVTQLINRMVPQRLLDRPCLQQEIMHSMEQAKANAREFCDDLVLKWLPELKKRWQQRH